MFALRRCDDLQDRGVRGEQFQMHPRELSHVAHLRVDGAGARQQIDDLARLMLHAVLLFARARPERRDQRAVSGMPVGVARFRVDDGTEARILRERPEIQAFESGADQPESRIDESAEQGERRDAEPVRRDRHAERARVEGGGEVGALAAHAVGVCAAYF